MSVARAVIGGVERHLGAWRPSPLRLRGVPRRVDLASLPIAMSIAGFPTSYDQGQLGSCGPNALAEIYEFDHHVRFSRLFLYWFTRATEGDFLDDGGVTIPDLLSVAHTMGAPLERTWPYEVDKFQAPPPLEAVVEGVGHRVERWDPLFGVEDLIANIAAGQPVLMGFRVPASMQLGETARTGIVNVPSDADPAIGGHAVTAFGYDRELERVQCTCHYGPDFGDHGSIWLPFAHFTSGNASDLAAVRVIS